MTNIWLNILYGGILILMTIIMHAGATRFILFIALKKSVKHHRFPRLYRSIWLSVYVIIMFATSLLEALLWAVSYTRLEAITDFEEALYFSIVTFTTLGYGDITLGSDWRILASLQAADGIIIFGWTTAIIMAIVQKLYLRRS